MDIEFLFEKKKKNALMVRVQPISSQRFPFYTPQTHQKTRNGLKFTKEAIDERAECVQC